MVNERSSGLYHFVETAETDLDHFYMTSGSSDRHPKILETVCYREDEFLRSSEASTA